MATGRFDEGPSNVHKGRHRGVGPRDGRFPVTVTTPPSLRRDSLRSRVDLPVRFRTSFLAAVGGVIRP